AADQEIGDVLEPTDRLVSIEQRGDATGQCSAGSAVCGDGTPNDVQREVVDTQVGKRSDRPDAVDRCVPQTLIIQCNQSNIQIDPDVLADQCLVRALELDASELLGRRGSQSHLLAARDGEQLFASLAGYVPARHRVQRVPVGDEATERGEVPLLLYVDVD